LPVFIDFFKALNKEEIEELEEVFESLYFYEKTEIDENEENSKFVTFLSQSPDFQHFFTKIQENLIAIRKRSNSKYSIKKEVSIWNKVKSFFDFF
jgi:hypothetical protein